MLVIAKEVEVRIYRLLRKFDEYRASAFGAVLSGFIPSRVKPTTFDLVFTASLLDAQHYRDRVKNKPASLVVLPMDKALVRFYHLVVVDCWPVASNSWSELIIVS